MINLITQNEIIRLRGLGYSFDRIAATLEVSKPTIMKTCKEYSREIDQLQSEQITTTLQDASATVEARSKLYQDLVKRIYFELASRDLASVSTDRLMAMLEKAERSLAAIEMRDNARGEPDFSQLTNDELATIAKVGYEAYLELA